MLDMRTRICDGPLLERELKCAVRMSVSLTVHAVTLAVAQRMSTFAQRLSTSSAHGRLSGETVLVRVFRTICEMLADRGFTLQSSCESSDDIMQRMIQKRSVVSADREKDGRSCLVFFDMDDKVGIKFVRTIREAHPDTLLIVVSSEGPTSFAKKEINDPWGEQLQFFTYKELTRNVSRHELVPTHEALGATERSELIARYNLKLEQLPPLLVHDPVRRYYDFRRGDVVRIMRRGVGQEFVPFYRLVQA